MSESVNQSEEDRRRQGEPMMPTPQQPPDLGDFGFDLPDPELPRPHTPDEEVHPTDPNVPDPVPAPVPEDHPMEDHPMEDHPHE